MRHIVLGLLIALGLVAALSACSSDSSHQTTPAPAKLATVHVDSPIGFSADFPVYAGQTAQDLVQSDSKSESSVTTMSVPGQSTYYSSGISQLANGSICDSRHDACDGGKGIYFSVDATLTDGDPQVALNTLLAQYTIVHTMIDGQPAYDLSNYRPGNDFRMVFVVRGNFVFKITGYDPKLLQSFFNSFRFTS